MDPIEWGGEGREPTPSEAEFAGEVRALVPEVDLWLHSDSDGRPWLLVSLDILDERGIRSVPRIDFDSDGATGGQSPAFLNWDSGVRATNAGIDTTPPVGFPQQQSREIAKRVAAWFQSQAAALS